MTDPTKDCSISFPVGKPATISSDWIEPCLSDSQVQQLFDKYGGCFPPGTEFTISSWAPSWRTPLKRLRWHWYFRTLRSWYAKSGTTPNVRVTHIMSGPPFTLEELRVLAREEESEPSGSWATEEEEGHPSP